MWRRLNRGFKAVTRPFKRQWFRRSRVVAIDVENDVDSVATSVHHCNRCECPCSCTCYCHTTTTNISPPPQTPAQGSSHHSVHSDHSVQERANQELAEADNRYSDSTRPCSPAPTTLFIPPIPASDYETVQTSQQAGGILFGSPRPSSYLSYATVAIQPPVAQDRAGQESPIGLPSGSSSTRLSPRPYNGWGVVPLPVLASPPPPADQTPAVNDTASAAAQSYRTRNDNLVGTGSIQRSSVATATTAAASLIEATEDLLNFPEVKEGSPNVLFRPVLPPSLLLQQDIPSTSTSHAVNHNRASSDRAPLYHIPLPTGYSARLGVYTNPNRAGLDPLEFSGETHSGTQSQSYYTGIDNVLANGQAVSVTGIHAASPVRPDMPRELTSEAPHLAGHTLLDAMGEAGGDSVSSGQPTEQFPLSYASVIRHNIIFEVRRLGLHLDSVIGHYIHRVMAGRTRSWSVGRRSQRQAFIGLVYLQRLIEEMGQHVLNVNGAEAFAILELISTFEGDLDRLTASLDRPSSGPDDSLFFTLLCIILPEGLNKLHNDYEERFRRIQTFYRS